MTRTSVAPWTSKYLKHSRPASEYRLRIPPTASRRAISRDGGVSFLICSALSASISFGDRQKAIAIHIKNPTPASNGEAISAWTKVAALVMDLNPPRAMTVTAKDATGDSSPIHIRHAVQFVFESAHVRAARRLK